MLTPSPTLQQNMATASPWFILTSKVAVGVGVGWRGGSTERDRRTNKTNVEKEKRQADIFDSERPVNHDGYIMATMADRKRGAGIARWLEHRTRD